MKGGVQHEIHEYFIRIAAEAMQTRLSTCPIVYPPRVLGASANTWAGTNAISFSIQLPQDGETWRTHHVPYSLPTSSARRPCVDISRQQGTPFRFSVLECVAVVVPWRSHRMLGDNVCMCSTWRMERAIKRRKLNVCSTLTRQLRTCPTLHAHGFRYTHDQANWA